MISIKSVSYTHLDVYKRQPKCIQKPEIYKSNLVTHAINTGHEFPDITNVTLIKHIFFKSELMYIHKITNSNILEKHQIYI